MIRSIIAFLLLFPLNLNANESDTKDIVIAVASNFIAPMKILVKKFEEENAVRVKITTGSSGKIYAQILQGAPFDAFFSADQTKPQKLAELGVGLNSSRFTYAIGKLVIWRNTDKNENAKEWFELGKFEKLSLANPKLAPYGKAAEDVLNSYGNIFKNKKRIVGENVAQAFQFVSTRNVDLGFVALSQVLQIKKENASSIWILPESKYTPIKQDAIVLRRAQDKSGVWQFINFIKGNDARFIIKEYGYET